MPLVPDIFVATHPAEPRLVSGLPASFIVVVVSRLVALFGVQLSTFALGVWIFQRSGSTADYALLTAMSVLPVLLVLPVSGSWTDRWGYHRVLPCVALADALTTTSVCVLAWLGLFQPAYAYVSTFLLGTSAAFLGPALTALIREVAAEEHLGRANGLLHLAWALTTLVGPVTAGYMMVKIGFVNVLALDACAAIAAGGVLVAALITLPSARLAHVDDMSSSARGLREGWRAFVSDAPTFASAMGMLAGLSCFNILRMLLTPFVLGRYNAAALGWVMALAGAGMLLGSLTVTIGGGAKQPMRAVLLSNALVAVTCLLVGLVPRLPILMGGAFLVSLATVVGMVHTDLIYQQRFAVALQGRLAAVRAALVNVCYFLATLLVGPAVDRLFEPALARPGTWANALGAVWGYGKGCGIALMWSWMGAALLLVTVWVVRTGALRSPDRAI